MTIALIAAFGISEFFTALSITGFVLAAEVLEGLTAGRGRRAIGDLLDMLPALSTGDEMVYASANLRSGGSSIEDSVVESTVPGRGIYLGGIENVVIERNVIRGTSNAGINVYELTVPARGGIPKTYEFTLGSEQQEGRYYSNTSKLS